MNKTEDGINKFVIVFPCVHNHKEPSILNKNIEDFRSIPAPVTATDIIFRKTARNTILRIRRIEFVKRKKQLGGH